MLREADEKSKKPTQKRRNLKEMLNKPASYIISIVKKFKKKKTKKSKIATLRIRLPQ